MQMVGVISNRLQASRDASCSAPIFQSWGRMLFGFCCGSRFNTRAAITATSVQHASRLRCGELVGRTPLQRRCMSFGSGVLLCLHSRVDSPGRAGVQACMPLRGSPLTSDRRSRWTWGQLALRRARIGRGQKLNHPDQFWNLSHLFLVRCPHFHDKKHPCRTCFRCDGGGSLRPETGHPYKLPGVVGLPECEAGGFRASEWTVKA